MGLHVYDTAIILALSPSATGLAFLSHSHVFLSPFFNSCLPENLSKWRKMHRSKQVSMQTWILRTVVSNL